MKITFGKAIEFSGVMILITVVGLACFGMVRSITNGSPPPKPIEPDVVCEQFRDIGYSAQVVCAQGTNGVDVAVFSAKPAQFRCCYLRGDAGK